MSPAVQNSGRTASDIKAWGDKPGNEAKFGSPHNVLEFVAWNMFRSTCTHA